jgi:geranylgeranyl reductase family protein
VYDVIVVGAGPAGSTTARLCAKMGLNTLLLDKKRFPREKLCGGGLTRAAINELRVTGLEIPPDIIEETAYVFRAFSGKHRIEVTFEEPFCYLVKREAFDFYLLNQAQQAGASFVEGAEVTDARRIDSSLVVKCTGGPSFRTKVVVGADGVLGKVARSIRGYPGKRDTGFCLAGDVPKEKIETFTRPNSGLDIWYGLMPRGYCWAFPKRHTYSIGIGCILQPFPEPKASLVKFLASLSGNNDTKEGIGKAQALAPYFRGYFIPVSGHKGPITGDGVLLAGDAAGFADPFTGEGLRYAISSGRLAAETVISYIRQGAPPNRSSFASYEHECWKLIRSNLYYAKWLAMGFYRSPERLINSYFLDPQECRFSLGTLTGDVTYRQLLKAIVKHISITRLF